MVNKNYRIKTDVNKDKILNVKLEQDVDFLEILSLKLRQEDAYKLHSSNYGVIVGRVLANDAFGIPNAKVSVFIALEDSDRFNSEVTNIYPYTSVLSNDKNGRRYNLLPDTSSDDCYKVVGTFPNKRLVLDDDTVLEVFDKYWKYTTVTNKAGDYMIFGLPTGNQQLHVDIDLSDIGILSQRPRDMIYKGYNITQFENASQFKESTNLDGLSQLYAQNENVYVYPFWGDSNANEIAITRCDIQIQYKFEPTCVFLGSVVSDNFSNAIGHNCSPTNHSGYNDQLITGEGTIEMIRKTVDGLAEEYQIQGNRLINGDGVWCYQIPMNLDYVGTDEYGNIVPTDNPNKGIPTKTSVRFRVSMQETSSEGVARHRAKYLVPNNPQLVESETIPRIPNGKDFSNCFEFGSATPDEYYRDLYWNKVYSVKNYIPRIQNNGKDSAQNYNALRTANRAGNSNPVPFNKLRFRMNFAYRILCMVMTVITWIIAIINGFFSALACFCFPKLPIIGKICPLKPLAPNCIRFSIGISEDEDNNVEYFPGCAKCGKMKCENPGCTKNNSVQDLIDTVQQTLSEEYDIVNMDFVNDWVNGALYLPLWYWKKTKKKSFFFGLFKKKAVNSFCNCSQNFPRLRVINPCSLEYADENMTFNSGDGGSTWHRKLSRNLYTIFGVIKEFENRDGLKIYYYAPGMPKSPNYVNEPYSVDYVRLYSTDIILLGSLNSCDLDGLPRPFLNLPSTTANVPYIKTVTQGDAENDATILDGAVAQSGLVEVTGMDWMHNGSKESPKYGRGLLFDLSCSAIGSKPKTCVNIERMSELGVTLDMFYQDYAASNGNLTRTNMKADGMITRYELVDNDTRAMFASLNHNGLTQKTFNKNTGYDSYKLHYIYPVDFDGRMSRYSSSYTKSEQFITYDYRDSNYLRFKFGDKKHYYFTSPYQFPLFNNSFYFYFGLHEGSTAIDKFNELFFSTCYQNTKYPFLMSVEKTPGKWCADKTAYSTDYGLIKIELDGIRTPYSYSLTDDFGTEIISEDSMYVKELVFGAAIKQGGGEYVKNGDSYVNDGRFAYFNSGNFVNPQQLVSNRTYKLTITDAKGQINTQLINLEQSPISVSYTYSGLGTKYNDSGNTVITDICNRNEFYGNIIINSISIDGKDYTITNVTNVGSGRYELNCQNDSSTYRVLLELSTTDSSRNFIDCTCNNTNGIASYVFKDNVLTFNIWIPGDYIIKATQYCDGVLNDNSSNVVVTITNGENFDAFINEVPLRFIIGKNENVSEYNRNFYNPNARVPSDMPGWFNVHNEKYYNYLPVNPSTESIWSIYSDVELDENDNITDLSKLDIIIYKFTNLFSMSNSAYVIDTAENLFAISHNGGKSPILYRGVYPQYEDFDGDEGNDGKKLDRYLIDSGGYVSCDSNHPNIVGFNYTFVKNDNTVERLNPNTSVPYFNNLFGNDVTRLGNYFAVFTQNAGIVDRNDSCVTDKNIVYQSIPLNANNLVDYICVGDSSSDNMEIPSEVYNKTNANNPYFRAEFVDRRLDYDYLILTPYSGDDIKMDENANNWKLGRFSGVTYNGIEMSYGSDYGIISSTKNDKIEYYYDLDSATTILNTDANYSKRFYSSELKCGNKTIDIKNCYWITNKNFDTHFDFNKDETNGEPYLINHSNDSTLYNGAFDMNNYPTKRLIDIGNLPNSNKMSLKTKSCNYRITPSRDDNDRIIGYTDSGEEVSFEIDCKNMVNPTSPSLEDCANNNTFNVLFTSNGSNNLRFNSLVLHINFKLRYDAYNSTHNGSTKLPKYIPVRKNGSGNIISEIKKAINISDINDIINRDGDYFSVTSMPSGIGLIDNYFYNIGDDGSVISKLYDDSSEFQQITFGENGELIKTNSNLWGGINMPFGGELFKNLVKGVNIGNVDVFSILIDRLYLNAEADFLSKNIRAIEFGSVYDVRGFDFKATKIAVETDSESEGEDPETSGTTVQVTEFEMSFGGNNDNSMLKNYSGTTFIFKFTIGDNSYLRNDITPIPNDANDVTSLTFNIKWIGNMNNIFIDARNNSIPTQVFMKTTNGLVYAFSFIISYNGGSPIIKSD
jgi:hypothetical protein